MAMKSVLRFVSTLVCLGSAAVSKGVSDRRFLRQSPIVETDKEHNLERDYTYRKTTTGFKEVRQVYLLL